jgi:hypothetical protein
VSRPGGAEKRSDTKRASAAELGYAGGMCRNIRTLFNFEPPATPDEIRAAALQFVRKVSGSTRPSRANSEAFDVAVDEIVESTTRLLGRLQTAAPARSREVEAQRAVARSLKRFATDTGGVK